MTRYWPFFVLFVVLLLLTLIVANAQPVPSNTTSAATVTLVALDVSSVTTGGTAVTALNAGHRTKGGWIQNPPSASVNLCVNEVGTASGTTSSGNTTCIVPGQTYNLAASANAVSVVSSDNTHAFSGFGFQ